MDDLSQQKYLNKWFSIKLLFILCIKEILGYELKSKWLNLYNNDCFQVLPVYVDYLGRFPYKQNLLETPADAMKQLLDVGVTDKRFLPNGELSSEAGRLILRDNFRRVSKISLCSLCSLSWKVEVGGWKKCKICRIKLAI